ncbi:type IX secretion system plug protein domain-containing protein [Mucilaginibacter sp. AK015]|uniref:type IX secretion system plug protein n=1 Tax=Mucilaginibacter sp. AK015 TaxID=2723072 RepID=UPI0021041CE9|nr:type IX secretion system plug protein domain-containing protein [Mucilaginibacter sp. AK015]
MKSFLLSLFLLISVACFAQSTPFDNSVYRHEIKSVEFYNSKKPASFPVIELGGRETVTLGFDDLSGASRTFNYALQHCDANWRPSNLSPSEYLESFTDDRINDYTYSSGTFQKYTHYEVKIPNRNIIPKISGNYILKVYEDGDPAKLILTRRLYVVDKRVSVSANIIASNNVSARRTNQKVNFTIDYTGLPVQNPNTDIRAFLMQNARLETGIMNNKPTYIRGTQLVYNDVNINDFAGRNEFRHFDTRTLKLNSERISKIYKDTANTVMLLGDPNRNLPNYTLLYDIDGKFFILNQDGNDPRRDADYAYMYFTLAANKSQAEGTAYIVGQFNDYKLDDNSKLTYDDRGRWYTNLLLKQGVYDYQYVWVSNATRQPDDTALEGNYFETENEYQLLVYYRQTGARYEQLVGYNMLTTTRQ